MRRAEEPPARQSLMQEAYRPWSSSGLSCRPWSFFGVVCGKEEGRGAHGAVVGRGGHDKVEASLGAVVVREGPDALEERLGVGLHGASGAVYRRARRYNPKA